MRRRDRARWWRWLAARREEGLAGHLSERVLNALLDDWLEVDDPLRAPYVLDVSERVLLMCLIAAAVEAGDLGY